LTLEAHRTGAPVVRWIGWGCEGDQEVWRDRRLRDGEGQFWLGDDLLVVAVGREADEAGEVDVYLPRRALGPDDGEVYRLGYILLAGDFPHYDAGQWVRISCPIASGAPVFAREGSAIPVGRDERTLAPFERHLTTTTAGDGEAAGPDEDAVSLPLDDYRAVELYPPPATATEPAGAPWSSTTWREEDDRGADHARGVRRCTVSYRCARDEIELRYDEGVEPCCDEASGARRGAREDGAAGGVADQERFVPAWRELRVILPPGEERRVVAGEGAPDVRLAVGFGLTPDRRARFIVDVGQRS
jgi:hypothetical protein